MCPSQQAVVPTISNRAAALFSLKANASAANGEPVGGGKSWLVPAMAGLNHKDL